MTDSTKSKPERSRKGGARPGAGRKPAKLDIVASDALTFLQAVVRDPNASLRMRIDAARAALPYLHPKKTEGKRAQAAEAARRVAGGKFAPGAAPLALVKKLRET